MTKEAQIREDLQAGLTWREVKAKRGVGFDRISRIASAIKNDQPTPLPLPIGRPRKVTDEVISLINQQTIDDPILSGSKLARNICEKLHISLSHTTINNIRAQLRFRFTHPRRIQKLTEKHIAKRLEFPDKQEAAGINWESDVIISDESRFCLSDDSRRIWLKRGVYHPNTFRGEVKFPKGIMVWGAIGKGWRSPLIIIKGRPNAQGYIDLLNENKIIEKLNAQYGTQYWFQQD